MNKTLRISATILLMILFSISVVFAETSKTLSEDTKLYPAGWLSGEGIKFKGGTVVKLNEYNEVTEGTLANNEELIPLGWRRVAGSFNTNGDGNYGAGTTPGYLRFQRNTKVVFNSVGQVISGTLDYDAFIRLFEGRESTVRFKCDQSIKYYDNEVVAEGFLRLDTYLKPECWRLLSTRGDSAYIKFKGGTFLKFNEKGEVMEGTVKQETKVWFEDGSSKVYPAGKTLRFTPKGAEE